MKNKELKSRKGITLIALVVTIVILLILAGITINLVLSEDGIIKRAQGAAEAQKQAEESDKQALESLDAQIDSLVGGTTGKNTYEIGEEVTVGGENFYVLEESAETVTLLAKYNLNAAGTAQAPNENNRETGVKFSLNPYWSSSFTNTTFDLNDLVPDNTDDAIAKAKSYAVAKGGTNGGLLTWNKANTLKDSYKDMIYGTSNKQPEGNFLKYWLGSAATANTVWVINGDEQMLRDFNYDDGINDTYGVRPVITVSKSKIS